MAHRIVFSLRSERHLESIYRHIEAASGPVSARHVTERLIEVCRGLETFPGRGILRHDLYPGLRVIGYRRWASIAFTVEDATVTIQGVLWRGRDSASLSTAITDAITRAPSRLCGTDARQTACGVLP